LEKKIWKKKFGILALENFERTPSWLGFMIEIAPREEGGNYPKEEGSVGSNFEVEKYFNYFNELNYIYTILKC
jgi:hypothetical protein